MLMHNGSERTWKKSVLGKFCGPIEYLVIKLHSCAELLVRMIINCDIGSI